MANQPIAMHTRANSNMGKKRCKLSVTMNRTSYIKKALSDAKQDRFGVKDLKEQQVVKP